VSDVETTPNERLLEELLEWLRIPSISTGEGDPAALERAGAWAAERIRRAGGEAELIRDARHNPLVVGELAASAADAPTVLIYGHYDVQGPGSLEAWSSPPFEPTIRDGRVYARGASDDKGNFLPLLYVACELAATRSLPTNVRVLIEGEEEVGGGAVNAWLRADERGADAAIIFDSGMADEDTPALTVGLRGLVQLTLEVRTAERNLHSGLYGGSVLNAVHVMNAILAQVLPGPDGRLRSELRRGVTPPAAAEVESWARLPSGEEVLAEAGGRPLYPAAGVEYYLRNGADCSLDVNEIRGGEPRTIVPAQARATLTMRLAPHQDPAQIEQALEELLRAALPAGAELEITALGAAPTLIDPDSRALTLAREAITRACGTPPVLVRSGGSIPIVADMAARGYPVILGGFSLPADGLHAPNESYALRSLALGESAARELLRALSRV
jgi:acetylornithine deacetylase/succinyl-diaminopimelate desuccinylase-like protein